MKKVLVTMAATLLTVAAFAQGTVAFSNGGLNRISSGTEGAASSTWAALPTTFGQFNFGLFYGFGATAPATLDLALPLGVNSTSSAGVIASAVDAKSALSAYAVPGSTVGQTDAWISIAGWSASYGTDWVAAKIGAQGGVGYFGQTPVINVGALGPTTGPGIAFWSTAAQTSPKLQHGGIVLMTGIIPEPSTMALAGLGIASMLIFRRRK